MSTTSSEVSPFTGLCHCGATLPQGTVIDLSGWCTAGSNLGKLVRHLGNLAAINRGAPCSASRNGVCRQQHAGVLLLRRNGF